MFGPSDRWMQRKQQAEAIPEITVTMDEFVQRCIAAGMVEEEARRQGRLSKILNSRVCIGTECLRIEDPE
jgi:hypothetical protein